MNTVTEMELGNSITSFLACSAAYLELPMREHGEDAEADGLSDPLPRPSGEEK